MESRPYHRSFLEQLNAELLLWIAAYLEPSEVEALWSASQSTASTLQWNDLEHFCFETLRRRYGSLFARHLQQAYRQERERRGPGGVRGPWSWRRAFHCVYHAHRWLFGVSFRASAPHTETSSMTWSAVFRERRSAPSESSPSPPWGRLLVQRFDQRAVEGIGNGALLAAVLRMRPDSASRDPVYAECALIVTPYRIVWFEATPLSGSDLCLDTERSHLLTTPLVLTAALSDDERLLVLGRRGCTLEVRDVMTCNVVAEARLPVRISKRDEYSCLDAAGDMIAAGTMAGRLLIFDCTQALQKGVQRTGTVRLKPVRMEISTSGEPLSQVRLCRSAESSHRPDLVVVCTQKQLRIYYIQLGLFIFQRDFERPIRSVHSARSRTCIYIASGSTVDIIELPALEYAATLGRPSIMSEDDQLTCIAVDEHGNVAGGWSSGHVTFWPARGRLVGIALTYHDRHLDLHEWKQSGRVCRTDLSQDVDELERNAQSAWCGSRSPIRSIYVDRDRVISASSGGVIEVFAHQQVIEAPAVHSLRHESYAHAWQHCRTARISIPNLHGDITHLSAGEGTLLGGLCGDAASAQRLPLVLLQFSALRDQSNGGAAEADESADTLGCAGVAGGAPVRYRENGWLPPADIIQAFWVLESSGPDKLAPVITRD
ncbi:hypothetical protein CYME_CMS366C [Cyanidioschyzon merolae strain 10D]|jgi:hypothetical protein|uniref:F-box domain-containing protein n=1 Tax=Cyanidioschyzon merolae (strain NIES-3377 / 10D) TaxID=280699 RepID=M1VM37_CYAM1|nr:hypothetical protein CYME_CMS366C [Cyanidioschyzon merolae strain 10D]BAM82943.1 hypothetical protein CYME_CMS366C [Cyanidioschyzon merolae strain 10D]|eukprot:XP_005538979.1 hypothetical protein CYME_CMS366C [Cyanidioschyzon merolae strain 10D]